jgi:hypothetical protein
MFDTEIPALIQQARQNGWSGRIYHEFRVYGNPHGHLNEHLFCPPSVAAYPPDSAAIVAFISEEVLRKSRSLKTWLPAKKLRCVGCSTETTNWLSSHQITCRQVGYWKKLDQLVDILSPMTSVEGPSSKSDTSATNQNLFGDNEMGKVCAATHAGLAPFRVTYCSVAYPVCSDDVDHPCNRKLRIMRKEEAKGQRKQVVAGNMISRTVCDGCKKFDVGGTKLKRCGRCKAVRYCSEECQRKDWSKHKLTCHELTAEDAEKEEIRQKMAEMRMN